MSLPQKNSLVLEMLQPQKIDELLKLLNYQNVRTIINPFWRTYTCRCTPIDFTHLWLTCSSHSTGSFPRSAKAWSPGESAIELRSKAKMMPKCGHELTNKMGKWASAAFKTTEELLFFEIQNSFKADIRLHQCIRSSVHKKKRCMCPVVGYHEIQPASIPWCPPESTEDCVCPPTLELIKSHFPRKYTKFLGQF